MPHIVEAGTDGAALLLFDPAALPDDFDERMQDEQVEVLEDVTREGLGYWATTDGDGVFLLHAYVEEDVAAYLAPYLTESDDVPAFQVPSGTLYFGGAEYGFKNDTSMRDKFPHMLETIRVPRGTYRLRVHRTAYPGGLLESELRHEVSGLAAWLRGAFETLVAISIMTMFAGIALAIWTLWPLLLGMACVALTLALRCLPPLRRAQAAWKAIGRRYPFAVVELRRRV